jgi:hypothetical protein
VSDREEEGTGASGTDESPVPAVVTVFSNKYSMAYPAKPGESPGIGTRMLLGAALSSVFPTDAHTSQYASYAEPFRLKHESVPERRPTVTSIFFDVDDPLAHAEGRPSSAKWWEDEKSKVELLRNVHPDVYVYRTRGGYRIVTRLPEPFVIASHDDGDAWKARYLRWAVYLYRRFEILADPACADWQHLFRLPHATRNGGPPEDLEVIGDPEHVGPLEPDSDIDDDIIAADALGELDDRWHGVAEIVRGKRKTEAPRSDALAPGPATLVALQELDVAIKKMRAGDGRHNAALHFSGQCRDAGVPREVAAGLLATLETVARSLPREASDPLPRGNFARALHDAYARAPRERSARAKNAAREWSAPTDADAARPFILVAGGELPRIVDEAEAALLRDADHPVHSRGAQLVALLHREQTGEESGILREAGTPQIRLIQKPNLIERLTRAAHFQKYFGKALIDINAPTNVAAALAARGEWSFPELVGVAEAPRLRRDGTILDREGYDRSTGIYYAPNADFGLIPSAPTEADTRLAVAELLETVVDFPFAGDDHRSAWLASLLTPFARPAIDGPTPLFLIDKNTHGTGGSLLADTVGLIVSGHDMPRAVHPQDDEEMRKRITAVALSGDGLLLFDNVADILGTPALNAALTGTTWKDRILGVSEQTPVLPLVTTWFASANNCSVERDTTRRVLLIRLDSKDERPDLREGFKHPDLKAWIRSNRPRLVRAALTILRAWFAAGRPETKLPSWGSYEAWSLVRHALVYAGQPDPARTRTGFVEDVDFERTALFALFDGLAALDVMGKGVTANEVHQQLEDHPNTLRSLLEAVLELCPSRDGRTVLPSTKTLGMKFHHLRHRVVGDRMLARGPEDGHVVRWKVVKAGTTGTTGTTSPQSDNEGGLNGGCGG